MAHTFTITPEEWKDIDGRMHMVWEVVQTDMDATDDQWTLSDLPEHFTITLFECLHSNGARTVNPKLGQSANFNPSGGGSVANNRTAAKFIRNQAPLRVSNPFRTLVVRTSPDQVLSSPDTITTRITLVEGHWL